MCFATVFNQLRSENEEIIYNYCESQYPKVLSNSKNCSCYVPFETIPNLPSGCFLLFSTKQRFIDALKSLGGKELDCNLI